MQPLLDLKTNYSEPNWFCCHSSNQGKRFEQTSRAACLVFLVTGDKKIVAHLTPKANVKSVIINAKHGDRVEKINLEQKTPAVCSSALVMRERERTNENSCLHPIPLNRLSPKQTHAMQL